MLINIDARSIRYVTWITIAQPQPALLPAEPPAALNMVARRTRTRNVALAFWGGLIALFAGGMP